MLYWLLYETLYERYSIGFLRLFDYVTVRTVLSGITALLLSVVLGPWLIRRLRQLQIGQYIREDGPRSHQQKAGTPTMGGLLIIISIVIPTLLWTHLTNPFVWIALFGLISFGAIGFQDDWSKVKKKQNLGLTARQKMGLQLLCTLFITAALIVLQQRGQYQPVMNVPFFKQFRPTLVIEAWLNNPVLYPFAFTFFFFFLVLVIVGSSNAVNITDGLDGLAIGLMVIASGAMTALTYVSGHRQFSEYLEISRLAGASELTIFCGAITGACLGFLWYNAHPAEVFMGDVGALGLGGALGTVAVLIKQELLLPFIGGVFVMEIVSVMLQVGSYKTRGKRIFKMAPLHHHFEAIGWQESKIITRFWIAGAVMALFALTTLKLR